MQQQFAMVIERQKKDREESEHRIMEIASTSQEWLKQELERREQERGSEKSRGASNGFSSGKGKRIRREIRSRKNRTEKGIGFLQSRNRDSKKAIRTNEERPRRSRTEKC